MNRFCAIAVVGLSLIGSLGQASAQYYGRPDYGYREPDYGYRERGPRYRDRDFYEEHGPRRGREFSFNEREYLRCNPDVLAAVRRGETSAITHYQTFGVREGRRLRC